MSFRTSFFCRFIPCRETIAGGQVVFEFIGLEGPFEQALAAEAVHGDSGQLLRLPVDDAVDLHDDPARFRIGRRHFEFKGVGDALNGKAGDHFDGDLDDFHGDLPSEGVVTNGC